MNHSNTVQAAYQNSQRLYLQQTQRAGLTAKEMTCELIAPLHRESTMTNQKRRPFVPSFRVQRNLYLSGYIKSQDRHWLRQLDCCAWNAEMEIGKWVSNLDLSKEDKALYKFLLARRLQESIELEEYAGCEPSEIVGVISWL